MKVCTRKDCVHGGAMQPLDCFSSKGVGVRRSECKTCQAKDNERARRARGVVVRTEGANEPKGWPVPSPPPLDEQILTYQLRKPWGGVSRGQLFAAVL